MSGLYNLVNGYSLGCVVLLPMLGRKADDYPRFRDCYLSEDRQHIDIYTRVGGGNRNSGFGEEELYKDENFVETFDDPYDSTYGTYRFAVPDKWKKDFDRIVSSKVSEVSDEYIITVKSFYPMLAGEGIIDKIFRGGGCDDTEEEDR